MIKEPGMLNELANMVHENAVNHGWWDDKRSFGEIIALFHSEVSEAWEEYRNHRMPTETYFGDNGQPEGIPTELADVIIRVLDYCGQEGIDIERAVLDKHNYNKTRPYKHGGKGVLIMKMTVELPWPPETRVYDISEFLLPSGDLENPEIVELWDDCWKIEVDRNGGLEAYYDDVCIDEFVLGEELFLSREEAERRVQALIGGEDEGGNDLEKV